MKSLGRGRIDVPSLDFSKVVTYLKLKYVDKIDENFYIMNDFIFHSTVANSKIFACGAKFLFSLKLNTYFFQDRSSFLLPSQRSGKHSR